MNPLEKLQATYDELAYKRRKAIVYGMDTGPAGDVRRYLGGVYAAECEVLFKRLSSFERAPPVGLPVRGAR